MNIPIPPSSPLDNGENPADSVSTGASAEAPARDLLLPSGAVDQTTVAFNVFSSLLKTDGLRSAMYSLLRLTPYQYISLFRFAEGKASSVVHVDRQNLQQTELDEVPESATYCAQVRDGRSKVVIDDALSDERTQTHVARELVRSYCGLPILDGNGRFVASLCLYDSQPRSAQQLDATLLDMVSTLLAGPGIVPPYPVRDPKSQD